MVDVKGLLDYHRNKEVTIGFVSGESFSGKLCWDAEVKGYYINHEPYPDKSQRIFFNPLNLETIWESE